MAKDAINPSHYTQYPIETIDMMISVFGKEKVRDHCLLTAFKYRMRLGHKDEFQQEMKKEKWYLDKADELAKEIEAEAPVKCPICGSAYNTCEHIQGGGEGVKATCRCDKCDALYLVDPSKLKKHIND